MSQHHLGLHNIHVFHFCLDILSHFLGQFKTCFVYVFGKKPQIFLVCKFSNIKKIPQRFGLEAFAIRNLHDIVVRMAYKMFMRAFIAG